MHVYNKKSYTDPEWEIEKFDIDDVISTSSIDDSDEPGIDSIPDEYEF